MLCSLCGFPTTTDPCYFCCFYPKPKNRNPDGGSRCALIGFITCWEVIKCFLTPRQTCFLGGTCSQLNATLWRHLRYFAFQQSISTTELISFSQKPLVNLKILCLRGDLFQQDFDVINTLTTLTALKIDPSRMGPQQRGSPIPPVDPKPTLQFLTLPTLRRFRFYSQSKIDLSFLQLTNLHCLDLQAQSLSNLPKIIAFKNLRALDLVTAQGLSEKDQPILNQLTQLQKLKINCSESELTLSYLFDLKQLKHLVLYQCKEGVTKENIKTLCRHLPSLSSLFVSCARCSPWLWTRRNPEEMLITYLGCSASCLNRFPFFWADPNYLKCALRNWHQAEYNEPNDERIL